jgi:hypothetical protein
MPQFIAYSPAVEIWGASLLGMVEGLVSAGAPRDEVLAALAQGGILDPDREGWYSQQGLLDTLRKAGERYGEDALRAAGRAIPVHSRFPPEVDSLDRALLTLDLAYQVNHRGGRIGHYACKSLGSRRMELFCDNPYGCALDLGILDALLARHGHGEAVCRLRHAPGTTCRKEGGRACIYHVTW